MDVLWTMNTWKGKSTAKNNDTGGKYVHLVHYWILAPAWRPDCTLLWKWASSLQEELNRLTLELMIDTDQNDKGYKHHAWLHTYSKWYRENCKCVHLQTSSWHPQQTSQMLHNIALTLPSLTLSLDLHHIEDPTRRYNLIHNAKFIHLCLNTRLRRGEITCKRFPIASSRT